MLFDGRICQHLENDLPQINDNRVSSPTCWMQDPKQESTILKLQELYDNLRANLKGSKRRSGLTVVDHAGTRDGHGAW